MHSFVKGLADTDFSLSLVNRKQKKYRYYPKVCVSLKSKVLVKILQNWLENQSFGVAPYYDYVQHDGRGYGDTVIHSIHINGRKNLEKWMGLISFRNPRHLSRYKKYKNGDAVTFNTHWK